MSETCTTCGHWRGLHHWETMQCPVNGNEDGTFRQTTYTEESAELAALRAENAELREALANLSAQFDDRGYPANTHANVKIALLDARAVLEK